MGCICSRRMFVIPLLSHPLLQVNQNDRYAKRSFESREGNGSTSWKETTIIIMFIPRRRVPANNHSSDQIGYVKVGFVHRIDLLQSKEQIEISIVHILLIHCIIPCKCTPIQRKEIREIRELNGLCVDVVSIPWVISCMIENCSKRQAGKRKGKEE